MLLKANISCRSILLEWTKLVCTPALGLYLDVLGDDVHVTSNVITYHCSA